MLSNSEGEHRKETILNRGTSIKHMELCANIHTTPPAQHICRKTNRKNTQ